MPTGTAELSNNDRWREKRDEPGSWRKRGVGGRLGKEGLVHVMGVEILEDE